LTIDATSSTTCAGAKPATEADADASGKGWSETSPRDERERAHRPAGDLRQVEPGDVLHHLAAAARDLSVGAHQRHADDEVADRAVARPARAERRRRDQAADGGAVGQRRVEREHLTVRAAASWSLASVSPASAASTMSDGA